MSLSSAASVISSAAPALVRTSNGEYTAASVFAVPAQAARRGLVRQPDGGYGLDKVAAGRLPDAVGAFDTAAARIAPGLLGALASLRLGG